MLSLGKKIEFAKLERLYPSVLYYNLQFSKPQKPNNLLNPSYTPPHLNYYVSRI